MQNVSRKVLVIMLLILAIGAIGVTAFIIYQIQKSQAPTSSSASGFGPNATTDLYEPIETAFKQSKCEDFFSAATLSENAALSSLGTTITSQFEWRESIALPQLALNCTYTLADNKKLVFYVYSYAKDTQVFDSQAILIGVVNKVSLDDGEKGYLGSVETFDTRTKYTFGSDVTLDGSCRVNIFDDQNDFYYASINYIGFGECKAEETINLNKEIIKSFIDKITNIVKTVTTANRNPNTPNIDVNIPPETLTQ